METRKPYPSDFNDVEWSIIDAFVSPSSKRGRPREVIMREIVNAIVYILRAGCAWRLLPHDFPPWQTVYYYLAK